jgi:competence protein ComEA
MPSYSVVRIDDMSELPWSRRQILVGAAVVLAVLVLAGRFLLHAGAARAPAQPLPRLPVARAAPAAATLLVVDVVGAVRRAGLQRLPQGSRIADAIARAGGATRRADLAQVNLAAPLADGEQVVVPAHGAPTAVAGASGAVAGPVHLSTASAEQLDTLPGIGPVTAQKIVAYREQHGAFRSVAELDAIPGIGPARIDELKGLVAP